MYGTSMRYVYMHADDAAGRLAARRENEEPQEPLHGIANINDFDDSDTETADRKMTPLEHLQMLKATSDQLHDEDLDAALASTWSPSRISSRPAKRARVELETAEQVGRKTVWGNACINNANVNADSAVREGDDSSGNGSDESDESDYSDDAFECQVQGTYNRLEVDQYC